MIYTYKIKQAVQLATEAHEINQKQKRKGKDIAYITHPLTVGLLLSQAGAGEDVVAAGILHDTIEDSTPEHKITRETLAKRFGEEVALLIDSVTEKNKGLSWEERKAEALGHIAHFSNDSLLLKSADIISNVSEILDDYKKDGDKVFTRFNAPKERIIQNYLQTIRAIVGRWPESPLAGDITFLAGQLQMVGAPYFMANSGAKIIEYRDHDENKELECPVCGWSGIASVNCDSEYAADASCPICGKMLLVLSFPITHPDKPE